jgi:hypothetical protein
VLATVLSFLSYIPEFEIEEEYSFVVIMHYPYLWLVGALVLSHAPTTPGGEGGI